MGGSIVDLYLCMGGSIVGAIDLYFVRELYVGGNIVGAVIYGRENCWSG